MLLLSTNFQLNKMYYSKQTDMHWVLLHLQIYAILLLYASPPPFHARSYTQIVCTYRILHSTDMRYYTLFAIVYSINHIIVGLVVCCGKWMNREMCRVVEMCGLAIARISFSVLASDYRSHGNGVEQSTDTHNLVATIDVCRACRMYDVLYVYLY